MNLDPKDLPESEQSSACIHDRANVIKDALLNYSNGSFDTWHPTFGSDRAPSQAGAFDSPGGKKKKSKEKINHASVMKQIDKEHSQFFRRKQKTSYQRFRYFCKQNSLVSIDLGGFHYKREMVYTTWFNFWVSLIALVVIAGYVVSSVLSIGTKR